MRLTLRSLRLAIACFMLALTHAASAAPAPRTWVVDGVERKALVQVPEAAKTQPTPVILVFHGHGGTMTRAAAWALEKKWPAALVVYAQGLPTPGLISDPEGRRAGWQARAGQLGDRDLKFVDAILASLRRDFRVDERRIYAMGHSNGGVFTYLLWAQRGEQFAAFGPIAAIDGRPVGGSVPKLVPRPLIHVAGEKDPLVKFEWQRQMVAAICAHNQCAMTEPLAAGGNFPSKIGAPVEFFVHPGGHPFPPAALERIVAFFQAHARPEAESPPR